MATRGFVKIFGRTTTQAILSHMCFNKNDHWSFQSEQWIIRPLACRLYLDIDIEDREVSDSDSSDFDNGGYLDCLERDELYLATRLASALFIRDILDEPSVEIGLAIVQNRLTRNHGPMPSYEDMQTPTPENLWGIITAVAADLIFAMEMHPVPPLTDDEEDAWRRVVKRIRDDYIEDPICVQPPPPPAAEDIEPPAAEDIEPPAAEDILPPAAEDNQPPAAEDQPPTPGPAEGSPPEAPPAEPTPAPRRTLRARCARAWRRVRRFFTCSATRTA
ncbi:uncharacterized protein [Hyperolius riggenbachi]|uniref:uncharacterized protein n=1 Tax=Hyperolius riggenbachi TaxID=752182 RepID=UPI0035A36896